VKKILGLIAILMLTIIILMAVAGCGSDGKQDGSKQKEQQISENGTNTMSEERKKTLVIATPGDIQSWDYALGIGFPLANEMFRNVYGRGIDYALTKDEKGRTVMDPANFQNILTEKVEISPDESEWTFYLKKGIKHQSGREVTAYDWYYYWERFLALLPPIPTWNLVGLVEPGGDPLKNIKVLDKYTIQFKSDGYNTLFRYFIIQTSGQYIADSEEIKNRATKDDPWTKEWLQANAAASGPYYLEARRPGEEAVFRLNENWAESAPFKPYFEKVILKVIPSSSDRMAMLLKGDVDVAQDLSPKEYHDLKDKPGVKVESYISANKVGLAFNTQKAPFDNVLLRKAVAYMLPAQEIIDQIYYGFAKPLKGPVPSHIPGSTDEFWEYNLPEDQAISKAKDLIEQAGHPNGFEFTLTYSQATPEHESMAVLVQAQLSKIGIKVNLEKLPLAAFEQQKYATELTAHFMTLAPWIPEPAWYFNLTYAEGSWGGKAMGYGNKKVNDILYQAIREPNLEKRNEMYRECTKLIMADLPLGYIANKDNVVAMRSDIQYVDTPESLFRYAWMSRE